MCLGNFLSIDQFQIDKLLFRFVPIFVHSLHQTISHKTSYYTYFQWTEDGQCFQIQYLALDTWPEVRMWNKKLKLLRDNEKK